MQGGIYNAETGRKAPWGWQKQGIMLSLFTMIICVPSQISAQDLRTAALTPGTEMLRQSDLPTVLSAVDQSRYQRIFALEASDAWAEADAEIARLQDKLLIGHVLAARYLGKSYRTSYPELVHWLERFADEPDAKAIYRLALHRQPHGAKAPPRPVAAALDDEDADGTSAKLSPRAVLVVRQIESLVPTAPHRAELLLAGPEAKRVLDGDTRAALRAEIAAAFLGNGEAQEALAASVPAENGDLTPLQHWEAGLAAWRLDRLGEAKGHFEALVRNSGQSPWMKSAAAVWSARVALRLKQPKLVGVFPAHRRGGAAHILWPHRVPSPRHRSRARFRAGTLHRARRARHLEPRGGAARAGPHRGRRARPRGCRAAHADGEPQPGAAAIARRHRPARRSRRAQHGGRADPVAGGRDAGTTARSIRCRAGSRRAASPSIARFSMA